MRILAISFFLPPDLFPQAIQIGRLLASLPAEIGVVCSAPQTKFASARLDTNFDRRFAFHEAIAFRPRLSGVAAMLARRFVPFLGRVPDEYRRWIPHAEKAALTKLRTSGFRPDVMVTFGEPMSDHLVGIRLKHRLGLPWIAHFSDPWFDNPFRRFEYLSRHVNMHLEARVIEAADRLIFTSEETLDLVMRKYLPGWRAKAAVLPHSFDPVLYPQPGSPTGSLTVRYLGNFYGHRSPVPLFRALRLLLNQEPATLDGVQFELVGSLPDRMQRHRSFRNLPEGLVRLHGSVSYSHSLALMSTSDLLLVIDGPDELSVFLPSKLIDYLGARVPILGIVPPGTSAKLLARLGAPIADPRKPSDVARALRWALEQAAIRREAKVWQPWGDPSIINEFDIVNVAPAFFRIAQDALDMSKAVLR
jgi:glycosyltransferase involved in cell wall biosynthesis